MEFNKLETNEIITALKQSPVQTGPVRTLVDELNRRVSIYDGFGIFSSHGLFAEDWEIHSNNGFQITVTYCGINYRIDLSTEDKTLSYLDVEFRPVTDRFGEYVTAYSVPYDLRERIISGITELAKKEGFALKESWEEELPDPY